MTEIPPLFARIDFKLLEPEIEKIVQAQIASAQPKAAEKTEEKEMTVLTIRTDSRSTREMIVDYGFSPEQEELLKELLDVGNDPMWAGVIY